MKKITIEDIQRLRANGIQVFDESGKKDIGGRLVALNRRNKMLAPKEQKVPEDRATELIEGLTEALKSNALMTDANIQSLMTRISEALKELKPVNSGKKRWQFTVARNKMGLIDTLEATEM